MENRNKIILNMSHAYFGNSTPTPESLRGYLEKMKTAFSLEDSDVKQLFLELEVLHSPTISGNVDLLEDATGHEEWFNPDTNHPISRGFEWHFWSHYRDFLKIKKGWSNDIVEKSLNRFSGLILSKIEDPLRKGNWDRRGMVVGNVQSGKTANYTALITKAIDAGYRLIVVMAGVHNSLRSQTQERLNTELLGYDLDVIQRITGKERRIGVRKIFTDHHVVNTLTSSADKGDFKAAVARQAGIIPSNTGDPIILIVKKHVTILKNLIQWATSLGTEDDRGNRVIQNVPLLLIDDECDYASVNTKKPIRDENNKVIEEWDPSKTNRMIRELLSSFSKSVYIGYTATPYANIFIHKDNTHRKYGDDLFPRNFLVSLPQPDNYIGPEHIFGLQADKRADIEELEPLPLVIEVNDSLGCIPPTHRATHQIDSIPDSLRMALVSFVLVCTARRLRSKGNPHNSMLIHLTRYTKIQQQVFDHVSSAMEYMTARIQSGTDDLADFRQIWETDFVPKSAIMKSRGFTKAVQHTWDEIRAELFDTIRVIRIKVINGLVGDTLDYRDAELSARNRENRGEILSWHEKGASVIAIGGDKLSRGLTLEGLSVSYYLRSTRMYDTLMQMGRWFGYRDWYNDLCRIYTTPELIEWYRHIALANIELKNEFAYMSAIGSTPEEFGLKVRNHPGRLAVTSAGKSRATEKLLITLAGRCLRTVVFNPKHNRNNMDALEVMVRGINRKPDRDYSARKPRYHWTEVKPEIVVRFLQSYKTQEDASKVVDPRMIADYVNRQILRDELVKWHVVLVSNIEAQSPYSEPSDICGYNIRTVRRKPLRRNDKDRISIGTMTNPRDECLDLTPEEYDELELNYERIHGKGKAIPGRLATIVRHDRASDTGLLLIYLPAYCAEEKERETNNNYGKPGDEVVGFAISFPGSDTAEPIEYIANSVYSEQEIL